MSERPAPRGRPRLIIGLLLLAAAIAVVDQVTKYLVEDWLTPGVVIPLIGDYLGLQLIYNPGAAFSLATGMTWVLTIIMVVVIVVVLRVARRLRSTAWTVALGLLLGGALGNLYDRLLRDPGFGRGHVVDFINYNGWFVGNIADIAIVAAAILIALLALLGREVDGTRSGAPESAGPADTGEEDAEEEYSPHVPQPSTEGADIASWAAGAPAVPATGSSDAGPEPVADRAEESDAAVESYDDDDVAPAWRPVRAPADEPAPREPSSEDEREPDTEPAAARADTPAAAATENPEGSPTAAATENPPAAAAPADPGAAPADPPRAATPPGPATPSRPPRRPSRRELRLAERDQDD